MGTFCLSADCQGQESTKMPQPGFTDDVDEHDDDVDVVDDDVVDDDVYDDDDDDYNDDVDVDDDNEKSTNRCHHCC